MSVGRRMFVGAVAAAFPDIDIVLRLVDPLFYLIHHRGVTHSLLLVPLWAALVASVLWLIDRRVYSWSLYFGLCALAITVHILGDFVTLFGTQILAPLSSYPYAFPTTFIIDPYLTTVLVVATILGFKLQRGRLVAVAGWVLILAYIAMQAWLLDQARTLAEDYRDSQGWAQGQAYAMPQPFSPFHWRLLVVDGDDYHIAEISFVRTRVPTVSPQAHPLVKLYYTYRPADDPGWRRRARFGDGDALQQEWVSRAWFSPAMADFRRFAQFPILVDSQRNERECAWFADIRFGMEGLRTPFIYGACQDSQGIWHLVRGDDVEGRDGP